MARAKSKKPKTSKVSRRRGRSRKFNRTGNRQKKNKTVKNRKTKKRKSLKGGAVETSHVEGWGWGWRPTLLVSKDKKWRRRRMMLLLLAAAYPSQAAAVVLLVSAMEVVSKLAEVSKERRTTLIALLNKCILKADLLLKTDWAENEGKNADVLLGEIKKDIENEIENDNENDNENENLESLITEEKKKNNELVKNNGSKLKEIFHANVIFGKKEEKEQFDAIIEGAGVRVLNELKKLQWSLKDTRRPEDGGRFLGEDKMWHGEYVVNVQEAAAAAAAATATAAEPSQRRDSDRRHAGATAAEAAASPASSDISCCSCRRHCSFRRSFHRRLTCVALRCNPRATSSKSLAVLSLFSNFSSSANPQTASSSGWPP